LLKLDDVGSHNFERMRERFGGRREFGPLSYVRLFAEVPASGRPLYQETLLKFCHPQTPFGVKATPPFIAKRSKSSMLHVHVIGPALSKLCQDLAVAFKGVRTVETVKPLLPALPRPKFTIGTK
jgi:hypothetical protein